MTYTEIAAWWGAGIATLVLLWDIYKWRSSGPDTRMTIRPNMHLFGDPELEGRDIVVVSATNIGDRATTLESMSIVSHPNRWSMLRNRPHKQFYVKNPGRTRPFPCQASVGQRWDGMLFQNDELVDLSKNEIVYCQLHIASRPRPVRKRLRIHG